MSCQIELKRPLLCLIFLFTISSLGCGSLAHLIEGFYRSSCPTAETIVRKVVDKAVSRNPSIGAGLIRMHFHDCFVRGCDASILLDSTLLNPSEKDHPANNPSLRGFEVIDEAKSELESACPGTVSCSDIIAFAARDSAFKLGRINYAVPAGRRDGGVSFLTDPFLNLPSTSFNADQLEQSFAAKGLSLDEMVTLSGAHSIGVSHCSSFSGRLYSYNLTYSQDPSMDQNFAEVLKNTCPPPQFLNFLNPLSDPTVPLDVGTANRLDNEYYKELEKGRGVLVTDQTLLSRASTAAMVRENAKHGGEWARKFAAAMVHMGSIDVLTGTEGEIRSNCRVVNF